MPPEIRLIEFKGKKYIALKDAKAKFNVPQPTLYYWASNAKVSLLDLDDACKDSPFTPLDIRHQYYFDIEELTESIRTLKLSPRSQ